MNPVMPIALKLPVMYHFKMAYQPDKFLGTWLCPRRGYRHRGANTAADMEPPSSISPASSSNLLIHMTFLCCVVTDQLKILGFSFVRRLTCPILQSSACFMPLCHRRHRSDVHLSYSLRYFRENARPNLSLLGISTFLIRTYRVRTLANILLVV